MPLPPRVGRYEIVDRLGEGGMGVVYLAKDPELRRSVAIKVLSGFSEDPQRGEELRERFAREARSVAALDHKHIVTIYDVGLEEGRPFIVMQFLNGETMAEWIRRKPVVPVARKLLMMIELCNGLGYAHRNEIIHRDIKPANIMVTADAGLKILDFGLARLAVEATTGLTRAGSMMGTIFYMSPEQAKGDPVDHRSDIFSVGVVLYELLTYRKPFVGDAPHLVLQNILQAWPPPVRDLVPSLDPDLDAIVAKALEKDRDRRYQNLQSMEMDLQRVLDQSSAAGTEATVAIRPAGHGVRRESGRVSGSDSQHPRTPSKIPNFEAISERRKAQVDGHLRAASAHLASGRYAEAVDECEHVVILDADEPRALEMLELAHRRIEDERVRGWIEEARADLSRGSLSQAEALISETLRLRPESADALQLQLQLRDRRREQERAAERVRGLGVALGRARAQRADGALDAAWRSVSEALAFDSAHAEALALRDELRAALDERQRMQALEEEAERAVIVAEEAAARMDFTGALAELAAAPEHPEVKRTREQIEAARESFLREKQQEAAVRRAAEAAAAREAAEARRLAEEQHRAAEVERRRAEEERRQEVERLEKEHDLERRTAQPVSGDTVIDSDTILAKPQARESPTLVARFPVPPETEERPAFPQRREQPPAPKPPRRPGAILVVAAAALLLVGGGAWGWWMLTDRAPPTTESEGPAPEKTDFAAALAGAEAEFQKKNLPEAIALIRSIPDQAPERTKAVDLLRRMRTDSADAANTAREKAQTAGASAETGFRDGEAKLREAESLQRPEDSETAIALYQTAAREFDLAASAAWTPAQLVAEANRLQAGGQVTKAIDYAVQALTRSPKYQPAMQFLNDRRREAGQKAREARDRARNAGASETLAPYPEGRRQEQSAEGRTAPVDTLAAVAAFDAATAAYGKAYEAALAKAVNDKEKSRLASEAQGHATRASQMLDAGDLPGARTAINAARMADPANPALAGLEKRLTDSMDADAKARDARDKAARDQQRITDVLTQSKGQSDAEAVATLQSLLRDFPTDSRIKQELSARTRPPPPADDRPAIVKVLDDFAAAYSAKNTAGIRAVWPGVGTAFRDTFADFQELTWSYQTHDVTWDPARPDTASATRRVSIKRKDRNGKESEDVRTKQFKLEKSSGAWRITAYTDVTR